MAMRLSIAFDTTAESWMSQQVQYDLWKASQRRRKFHVTRLSNGERAAAYIRRLRRVQFFVYGTRDKNAAVELRQKFDLSNQDEIVERGGVADNHYAQVISRETARSRSRSASV